MKAEIVLIDDDPDSRDALSRFLTKSGHSVRSAADGNEALHLLGSSVPELIVLDYRMPDMDGMTVLGVLRSYLRWFHVPVIVLTAYPDEPRLRQQAAEFGVARIFVKATFKFDELLQFIEARIRPRVPLPPRGDLGIAPSI